MNSPLVKIFFAAAAIFIAALVYWAVTDDDYVYDPTDLASHLPADTYLYIDLKDPTNILEQLHSEELELLIDTYSEIFKELGPHLREAFTEGFNEGFNSSRVEAGLPTSDDPLNSEETAFVLDRLGEAWEYIQNSDTSQAAFALFAKGSPTDLTGLLMMKIPTTEDQESEKMGKLISNFEDLFLMDPTGESDAEWVSVDVGDTKIRELVRSNEDGDIRLSYTVVSDRVIFGDSTGLRSYLTNEMVGLEKRNLARNKSFRMARDLPEAQTSFLFVNLETIIDRFWNKGPKGNDFSQNVQEAMQMKFFENLGLTELTSYYLSLGKFKEKLSYAAGLTYKSKQGLLKVLPSEMDFDTLAAFPEKGLYKGSFGFDIGEMIEILKDTTLDSYPMAKPAYDLSLSQAKEFLGLDIETVLMNSFRDETHLYFELKPEKFMNLMDPEQIDANPSDGFQAFTYLFGFGIQDEDTFRANWEQMIMNLSSSAPGGFLNLQKKLHSGVEVTTFYVDQGLTSFPMASYAITNDLLLVCFGDVSDLDTTVDNLSSGKSSQSPLVQEALQLSDNPNSGVILANFSSLMEFYSQIFDSTLQKQALSEDANELDKKAVEALSSIDWDRLKALDLKLVSLSESHRGNFLSRTLILASSASEPGDN